MNLGRHNLTSTREPNAVVRKVQAIHVHPDWTTNIYGDKWDADLAILLLDNPVEFSNVIQPVCLPQNWDKFKTIEEGTLVIILKFLLIVHFNMI